MVAQVETRIGDSLLAVATRAAVDFAFLFSSSAATGTRRNSLTLTEWVAHRMTKSMYIYVYDCTYILCMNMNMNLNLNIIYICTYVYILYIIYAFNYCIYVYVVWLYVATDLCHGHLCRCDLQESEIQEPGEPLRV